jgi:hypothetical protein
MADDKNARDKQADDEDRRQREREMQEAVDRANEPEPMDAWARIRRGIDDTKEPTTFDWSGENETDRTSMGRRGLTGPRPA